MLDQFGACLHESFDCSGAPSGRVTLHSCNDCDYAWTSYSEGSVQCEICGYTPITGIYTTKDSGKRESFESGAVRDTQDNKPRYDLIPPKGLRRVADVYARGAVKYDDHNWRKGMPSSRFMASLLRHVEAYRRGERDEDHIAQAIFNALALIEFEGTEFDDLSTMWTDDDGS